QAGECVSKPSPACLLSPPPLAEEGRGGGAEAHAQYGGEPAPDAPIPTCPARRSAPAFGRCTRQRRVITSPPSPARGGWGRESGEGAGGARRCRNRRRSERVGRG